MATMTTTGGGCASTLSRCLSVSYAADPEADDNWPACAAVAGAGSKVDFEVEAAAGSPVVNGAIVPDNLHRQIRRTGSRQQKQNHREARIAEDAETRVDPHHHGSAHDHRSENQSER